MGYSYGYTAGGRMALSCQQCFHVGGVRKRPCPVGYCPDAALCPVCYARERTRSTRRSKPPSGRSRRYGRDRRAEIGPRGYRPGWSRSSPGPERSCWYRRAPMSRASEALAQHKRGRGLVGAALGYLGAASA